MAERLVPVLVSSRRILAKGVATFRWEHLGAIMTRGDGKRFRVFRQILVRPGHGRPQAAGGVFRVWFYSTMKPESTIAMSWKTIPLFLGMRGFRSKTWLFDEKSGEFGGVYEWDSVEQARAYGTSYAMRLSSLRAPRGGFSVECFGPDDPRASEHAELRLEAPWR